MPCLCQLRKVNDHEQVPEIRVEHLLKLDGVHFGNGLDQVPELSAHRVVRVLTTIQHCLYIPTKYFFVAVERTRDSNFS
jgi:hypothetical protein